MGNESKYTEAIESIRTEPNSGMPGDYSCLLESFSLTYRTDEHYIHVGEPRKAQGWLLHLTVIPSQISAFIGAVIPALLYFNVPFKLIKNITWHKELNAGLFGQFKIGKVLTAYLDDEAIIVPLIESLIPKTEHFSGPQVFTDFYLQTILYTRYGSFVSRIETDAFGNLVRVIEDNDHNLIVDKYYTPPIVPTGIQNPFLSIIEKLTPPPKSQWIGGKYLPLKRLKSDAKGDVWKALYFKWNFLPTFCVIKQGRKGMFPDDNGRDARERLIWQYHVGKELSGLLPMPKVIGLIREFDHVFLSMEYVKNAKDLYRTIGSKLKNTLWYEQTAKTKRLILDYLLQIIRSIKIIHQREYVHRDITMTNFLVDKDGKIRLIDLELIYSLSNNQPNPPFGVGTDGFMSPEQYNGMFPTKKDDSYSMGAMMIMLFTGINPLCFLEPDPDSLQRKLEFFIHNKIISSLICNCLSLNPDVRPDTGNIEKVVVDYKADLDGLALPAPGSTAVDVSLIKRVIQNAVNALGGDLMAKDNLWFSPVENEFGLDVYPMKNKHFFTGLYRGVGGVIYLLTRAMEVGFDISNATEKINAGMGMIREELAERVDSIAPSFYYGKAGLALVTARAVKHGFLAHSQLDNATVLSYFKQAASSYDLIYGIAGQGFGALQCKFALGGDAFDTLLHGYVEMLVKAQLPDGSWSDQQALESKDREKLTGFGYGIAGIVYFLLVYTDHYPNERVMKVAEEGLNYLARNVRKMNDHFEWRNSNKTKSSGAWWCQGAPGISLAFLKGYETTQDARYLRVAEKALYLHPARMVYNKLGQCHGMSGLGEIYLEAYRITGNNEWKERANWIVELILNLRREPDEENTYWLVEQYQFPTADFMTGNSGVIHFLLRYCYLDEIGFPLFS